MSMKKPTSSQGVKSDRDENRMNLLGKRKMSFNDDDNEYEENHMKREGKEKKRITPTKKVNQNENDGTVKITETDGIINVQHDVSGKVVTHTIKREIDGSVKTILGKGGSIFCPYQHFFDTFNSWDEEDEDDSEYEDDSDDENDHLWKK